MEQRDLYHTARILIDQHGDKAVIHAAIKANALLAKGDLDGATVWRKVIKAIEELSGAGDGTETRH